MDLKGYATEKARRISALAGAGVMLIGLSACTRDVGKGDTKDNNDWNDTPAYCESRGGGHDYSRHVVETIRANGDKKVCEYILSKSYTQCANCGDIEDKVFDGGDLQYVDENNILKSYKLPDTRYTVKDYIEYKVINTIPHSIKNPDNLTGVCENCGKEVRATKFNPDNCKYNSYELVD